MNSMQTREPYKAVERTLKGLGDEYLTPGRTSFEDYNFVTPNVVRRGKLNGFQVELSYGRGFGDCYVYGVSVKDSSGKNHPVSKCCHTFEEVEEVLQGLKEGEQS